MTDIWFISDTHFFHGNMLKFADAQGQLIRGHRFTSVGEMNECMIQNWNALIKPGDKVYHLGDVTFTYGAEFNELMSRLNGRKRLVIGNHDIIKGTNLINWFEKISLWRVFKEWGFVATHIPIAHGHLPHRVQHNVHGHTHQRSSIDPHYLNICVEVTDYHPIHIDEIKAKIQSR